MISDTAQYHGAFFALLLDELDQPVSIRLLSELGAGYYLLAGCIPVFLKHSKKRKGPWQFNFFRSHQEKQQTLYSEYGECFTCLICGRDGIVGLDMTDLREVLDGHFEEQECISVRRSLRGQYRVRGRDGALESRINRRSIFDKLKVSLKAVTEE